MAGRFLLLAILAANIFGELNFYNVAPLWVGRGSDKHTRLIDCLFSGAYSAIIFRSNDNVTVIVRFPAELRCVAFIDDNIHIPLIRWYRENGTPVSPYAYY